MTDNEIYEAYECCIIEKRQKKEQKELAKARRGTWFGGTYNLHQALKCAMKADWL